MAMAPPDAVRWQDDGASSYPSGRASHVRATVHVPCYDEEEAVENLARRLLPARDAIEAETPWRLDLLLFDNGSTDRTLERLREAFAGVPRARVHHSPVNLNVGGSLRAALPLTDAEVVVQLDADCTYDPLLVRELLRALDAGADVAIASPYHPQGAVEGVPPWRLVLSHTLSRLYRLATRLELYTYTSMVRAYRRRVLEAITWQADGFLATAEIAVRAHQAGFHLVEVPAVLHVREFGQSKIRVARVARDHVLFLARLAAERGQT